MLFSPTPPRNSNPMSRFVFQIVADPEHLLLSRKRSRRRAARPATEPMSEKLGHDTEPRLEIAVGQPDRASRQLLLVELSTEPPTPR